MQSLLSASIGFVRYRPLSVQATGVLHRDLAKPCIPCQLAACPETFSEMKTPCRNVTEVFVALLEQSRNSRVGAGS